MLTYGATIRTHSGGPHEGEAKRLSTTVLKICLDPLTQVSLQELTHGRTIHCNSNSLNLYLNKYPDPYPLLNLAKKLVN